MKKKKTLETKKTKEVDVKYTRPSWDEYFLKIMEMVGTRGTCDRGRSGCVVVKNKRILTTGFVGSPIGMAHCDDVGHEMHRIVNEDLSSSRHCIRTIHAESNAIAQAARLGISLDGATLYCKMVPCYTCAKFLINSGITRVVAYRDYHAGERTKKLFSECNITLDLIDKGIEAYKDQ